jgi:SSS family solute:Na+ symporter
MAYLFLFQPKLIGFTWYTAIGLVITMVLGWVLSLRHHSDAPADAEAAEAATP